MKTDNFGSDNIAIQAMQNLQDGMSGAAKEAGINSEDDVMDMLSEIDREELYAKLKQGLEDVEQGKTTPLSEALDEIKEMLEKRRKEIEKQRKQKTFEALMITWVWVMIKAPKGAEKKTSQKR